MQTGITSMIELILHACMINWWSLKATVDTHKATTTTAATIIKQLHIISVAFVKRKGEYSLPILLQKNLEKLH